MAPLAELVLCLQKGKGKKLLLADIEEVSMNLVFGSSTSFACLIPSSGYHNPPLHKVGNKIG
jgi:hypothetical protein